MIYNFIHQIVRVFILLQKNELFLQYIPDRSIIANTFSINFAGLYLVHRGNGMSYEITILKYRNDVENVIIQLVIVIIIITIWNICKPGTVYKSIG